MHLVAAGGGGKKKKRAAGELNWLASPSLACSTRSAHIQSALIGCEPPRCTRMAPCGARDRRLCELDLVVGAECGCCGCSVFFYLIPETARYYVLYVFET